MKQLKKSVLMISLVLLLIGLTSCSNKDNLSIENYSYSDGIAENGYWENVKALDLVELLDYKNLKIPSEAHAVSATAVQENIDYLLGNFAKTEKITEGEVMYGDTVNIDFVGTVDGVEFENGSTGGQGTTVTIGITNYIDDFLEQLVGHKVGDTVNVEVTFPEDYGVDNLNGKDAIFVTEINYIEVSTQPEVTDSFVQSNFTTFGWTSVKQMEEEVEMMIKNQMVEKYVKEYLYNEAKANKIPNSVKNYMNRNYIYRFNLAAEDAGVEFDEYLKSNKYESTTDLISKNNDEINNQIKYSMMIQAIAEDLELEVSDEEVTTFFNSNYGEGYYDSFLEVFGKPYLKQSVLVYKVIDYIVDNAELQ